MAEDDKKISPDDREAPMTEAERLAGMDDEQDFAPADAE